jgi:DNA processing protein
MTSAILFKALQRKRSFRNPDARLTAPPISQFTIQELESAADYLHGLDKKGIRYTHPEDPFYPAAFKFMLEPPLFLEYIGEPVWMNYKILSIVGSRKIHSWTERWMNEEIADFIQQKSDVAICSGGAIGVDQCAHSVSMKCERPTIVVLPCGVENLFPANLKTMKKHILHGGGCLLSEFESAQGVRKQFFYFRNRLITSMAAITLVAQAERRSGSFLTVHHALQNGKFLLTVPAHPMMSEFSGNVQLIKDGCQFVLTNRDLLIYWDL